MDLDAQPNGYWQDDITRVEGWHSNGGYCWRYSNRNLAWFLITTRELYELIWYVDSDCYACTRFRCYVLGDKEQCSKVAAKTDNCRSFLLIDTT